MGSCFTEHSRNLSFRYNSENYYCLQCKEEKQVTLFWFSVCFASKTTVFVVGAKGKRGEKKSAAIRGEVRGRRQRSLGFVKQARDGEEESDGRRMGDVDKQVETAARGRETPKVKSSWWGRRRGRGALLWDRWGVDQCLWGSCVLGTMSKNEMWYSLYSCSIFYLNKIWLLHIL